MPVSMPASLRSSRIALAALLACGVAPQAWADRDAGRETLGVESSLQLPAQA